MVDKRKYKGTVQENGNNKKKKNNRNIKTVNTINTINTIDTSKPSAIAQPSRGRRYTVSLAIAGSIIDNVPSLEKKTALAGQIARSLAIFKVDEIIIYQESPNSNGSGCAFLARILQYLETPQYLRKALFPIHADLKFAGLLNPLDCPHHLRQDQKCEFREGVTVSNLNNRTQIDCGEGEIDVEETIKAGVRVTIDMRQPSKRVVNSNLPRHELGYYWGYKIRLASQLSEVLSNSPYENGYDFVIGTSERGELLDSQSTEKIRPFHHLLICFGGVAGLEHAVDSDSVFSQQGLHKSDAGQLFDLWINTCHNQGSRTIRAEEAVLITMGQLNLHLEGKGIY